MKSYLITTIVHTDHFKGLKISKVNNDNLMMLSFRKNSIFELKENEFLQMPGIYFLVSNNKDSDNLIYVGQSTNIQKRILEHVRNDEKEFEDVFVFINSEGNLSKTYIDFLEWHYIQKVSEQNYYISLNKDARINKPKINQQESILVEDYIEKIDQLL